MALLPQAPTALSQYLQEGKVSQETRADERLLACQEHFQAKDSDIFLVTTPKSGTTWLKAILFSLVKRGKHYHADHQNHPLLTTNRHVLVPFLELNLYLQKPVPDLMTYAPPRLFSTHLPLVTLPESIKESACKVVYLCRNPKDTFVSLWHFANRLRPESRGTIPLEEALGKFYRGVSLYGPFWDHVLGYWNESLKMPERVLFIKYEEMKEEPGRFSLRRLAEFLGEPIFSRRRGTRSGGQHLKAGD